MIPSRPGHRRPGAVTAAGYLLIVEGVLAILAGLFLFTLRETPGPALSLVGVFLLAVGVFEAYAGVQVLALREMGRRIGIGLAVAAGVLSLVSLRRTPFNSLVNLLISGFVIWALTQNAEHFTE